MTTDPEAPSRSPEEEDRELIAAAQQGDAAAFEALVNRHRNRVFWLAHQVVGNAEDARDVAQNVLVRLWRVLPRYDPRYAFTTWLYRMTMNLAIDSHRRLARSRQETSLDGALVPDLGPAPREAAPGPEAAAAGAEVGRIFEELKALLPPQQRLVFALSAVEGLTSEEVGEVLGLSGSTVRNHLLQARRTLQAAIARRYPEYLPATRRGRSKA